MHCYVGRYILTSVTPTIATRLLPITSLECCHTLHQNVYTMLSDSPLVVSPLPCSSVGAPPCNLVCLSNANFYTTRGVVADGTSCSPSTGYDKASCLRGACTVSMRGCRPLVTIPVFISFACMSHLLWQLCVKLPLSLICICLLVHRRMSAVTTGLMEPNWTDVVCVMGTEALAH